MKPFNSLLGETFELQRDGFRLIAEQVSHHPPVSALHCDHPAYTFYASTEVKSSFKGAYLSVNQTGKNHLILKGTGDHFVWEKPYTNVHNIIIGKIYVEHYGKVEILNDSTGEKAVLDFKKGDGLIGQAMMGLEWSLICLEMKSGGFWESGIKA